ncbi:putative nuclear protein localization factor and ER translocation component [Mycosarcoma maydis]|uniref:Nuclear protein localization protein 4 n=1 Tax=Mycosarcoma maydis TaxID=5270 RepID=A0A0D1EDM6_MYCMD|nr:putative nuclear protein localization factor and ER translocation component [Ustilago maydis 521]KIS72305.1 putative nuclear protein localization factor and ER translocation component [Ustilago maydis 521]|eukprot:XP_011386504.1 putative nuclear protein localization factor and ER translocation component [Ustilago maydis 521]
MIVRVRSKDGNFRFELQPTDDASQLIAKVLETMPNADSDSLNFSNQPRGGEFAASTLKGSTLAELGIAHGHLLFASYKERPSTAADSNSSDTAPPPSTSTLESSSSATASSSQHQPSPLPARPKKPWEAVEEHTVDTYWQAQQGKITRKKDSQFCRHGPKGMCDYCMPLEPYDSKYQTENNIKHLSFHAYLRKQDIATNKPSQSFIPPLEEVDYSVKKPCPSASHLSWPAGICTKCQPSAITLQRQPYRMVDHVEFAHPDLIENILSFWRSTATQRFGFLLGRYEAYHDVPMGIKAVVEAIHEPPQEGELDGLTLGVPWEEQPRVEKLAKLCGLEFVGMIYSDLSPADPTHQDPSLAGKVVCKRHKDSFFLSGIETIFAAQLQLGNPNPSRFSSTGRFNSKFVTCILSGTEEGAIDVSAYQISEQGMGMVQADMIEASVNPNIIRVKPSEGERYVPEVFYRYTNEYKIDVKESAKPTFPVEYLIVNATHGFPNAPNPTFLSSKFPIENRPGLHDQDLTVALTNIGKIVGQKELFPIGDGIESTKGKSRADDDQVRDKLVGVLSDWHLLAFLDTSGFLDQDDMAALCRLATTHDSGASLDALLLRPGWQTLMALAREHAPHSASGTKASDPPKDQFIYDGGVDSDDDVGFDDANEDFYDDGQDDDDDDDEVQISHVRRASARNDFSDTDAATAAAIAAASADDAPAGVKVCSHCTYHNEPSASDCEICGLPL